jgi:hypothetical protein
VTIIAIKPVFGLVHIWSKKTLDEQPVGSVRHGAAEILTVIA